MKQPTKKGKPKNKYDWIAIRKEFVRGDYLSIPDFLEKKQMPAFYKHNIRLSGVVKERDEYRKSILAKANEKQLDDDADDVVKIRRRQARLARFMQLKAAEAMKDTSLKVTSVEEARKLLQSGLEQERKALGLDGGMDKPGSLTQININNTGPKTQLDRLLESASYEDTLRIIAELKRGREGGAIPEIIEGSPTEAEGEV